MPRKFEEIAADLRSDGGLRDFYIRDTNAANWNKFLVRVRSRLEADCFTIDGEFHELPLVFEAIKQIRLEANPCLSIPVAGGYVNCHFFSENEIEMDFRPEDFRTSEGWSELCRFFQEIVDGIGKVGIITYENAQGDVIERLEPRI